MDNDNDWPDIVIEDVLDADEIYALPLRSKGLWLVAEDYDESTRIWRGRTVG